MHRTLILWLASAVLIAAPARADVVDAGPTGFALKITTTISAAPPVLYRTITEQVGAWWSSAHTFSGSASNLSIEARAGGCFCEKLANGGVRHMTVTHVMAPDMLVLNGGLGPLGTMGVAGTLQWSLTAQNGRTELEVTYDVGGYAPGGYTTLAPLVDRVLTEQVTRLKTFVETGRPQ